MTLLYGHSSHEILELQQALLAHGFDVGPEGPDGGFGAHTLQAVKDAQAAFKLNPVDGVVRDDLLLALGIKAAKTNPITDFFTGLAIKAALSQLKGLPAMAFLTGYKTYIIGGLLIILGGVELIGIQIPGMTGEPLGLIMTGIGLITGRVATQNVAAGK